MCPTKNVFDDTFNFCNAEIAEYAQFSRFLTARSGYSIL